MMFILVLLYFPVQIRKSNARFHFKCLLKNSLKLKLNIKLVVKKIERMSFYFV